MIRRWSYLNFNEVIGKTISLKLKKKSKLSIFKLNVKYRNLKKLKLKFTKIKRRAFKRLKHGTSLMMLSNIFKHWTVDYRFIRNIARFDYYYGITLTNFIIYNYNYIKLDTDNSSYSTPFLFSNFNQSLYFANYLHSFKHFSKLFFKHNTLTYAWSLDPVFDESDNHYLPILSEFDLHLFTNIKSEHDLALDFNWSLLFDFVMDFILTNLIITYSFFTVFFFYSINFKKMH